MAFAARAVCVRDHCRRPDSFETWRPGERPAQARLDDFIGGDLGRYHRDRDRPESAAISRLSPYLHFGEISPRHVWHAVAARVQAEPALEAGGNGYLRELGWREFYAHVLVLHPEMPDVADDGRG